MDIYGVQQILERCSIYNYIDVRKQFEEVKRMRIVKMLIMKKFGWGEKTCDIISIVGECDLLKYAHENGCPWNNDICFNASRLGHLECLKYAHENGILWSSNISYVASHEGHLECLKYGFKVASDFKNRATS